MNIASILSVSTKDIPGKICTVIFTAGCNFNCDFCHNKKLISFSEGKEIGISEIIREINRNELISAVNITGGEPTLQDDLVNLCRELKKNKKYVSIDTNGSKPKTIKRLLPYVDRIAMDLKSELNKEKMKNICGTEVNLDNLISSIEMINENKYINFEIRTTIALGLNTGVDIFHILNFLKKINFTGNYVLQQFINSEGVKQTKEAILEIDHNWMMIIARQCIESLKSINFKIFLRNNMVGYREFRYIPTYTSIY